MCDALQSTTLPRFLWLYAAMYAAFGVASPFLPAFVLPFSYSTWGEFRQNLRECLFRLDEREVIRNLYVRWGYVFLEEKRCITLCERFAHVSNSALSNAACKRVLPSSASTNLHALWEM